MFDRSIALIHSKLNSNSPGRTIHFMLLAVLSVGYVVASAADTPRVFVLPDIENEPDDAMSMVRFLTYSNQFDVEGLEDAAAKYAKLRTSMMPVSRSLRRHYAARV